MFHRNLRKSLINNQSNVQVQPNVDVEQTSIMLDVLESEETNLSTSKNVKGAWNNTSEVTTLIAGNGINISDDGSGSPVIAFAPKQVVTFTTSGTWTVPNGITSAKITLVGGGGNGGTANTNQGGGGGGGGAMTVAYITDLTPSLNITVTIGTSSATITGSSISYIISGNPINIYANGGGSASGTNIGTGGTAFQFTGNVTGYSIAGTDGKGGDGTGGYIYFGGNGGNSPFFAGGGQGYTAHTGGVPGKDGVQNSGGGGSGGVQGSDSGTAVGGNGGSGFCIIEF